MNKMMGGAQDGAAVIAEANQIAQEMDALIFVYSRWGRLYITDQQRMARMGVILAKCYPSGGLKRKQMITKLGGRA
jgi:hypothetical protein